MSTTIDTKDIASIVEDGLKKTTAQIQKEIKEGNEETLKKAMEAFETARQESLKEIEAKKEELQKDYDAFATAQKEASQNQNQGKVMSFDEAFAKTLKDAYPELKSAMQGGKLHGHTIEMKSFDFDDFTGYTPFVTDYLQPIENKYDQFHFRNIIPLGSTTSGTLSYPKEGTTTGAANAWGYGTGLGGANESKPDITPTFAPYTVKVEWIAGLIKSVPIEMLEDLAWLGSFLSNKARRELLKAEDNQILNGNGTTPQMDGLLNNAVAYDGSYTVGIEQLVDAAQRQLADNYHVATDMVMSNADKVAIILNKASGSGEFDLPDGAIGYVNGMLMIDGVRVHSTPQLSAGTALVGAFNESQLVIRSAPRLRMFDQNEDDATKNVVMMRIEERAALAIYYANAFVNVTIAS